MSDNQIAGCWNVRKDIEATLWVRFAVGAMALPWQEGVPICDIAQLAGVMADKMLNEYLERYPWEGQWSR